MPVLVRPNGRSGRLACAAAAVGFAALVTAGCGVTSGSPTAASSSSSGFSAYFSCLRQHGVKVPTSRPSGAPSGGGGFGGGGFGGFSTELAAFRSCMLSHGEPVPTTRPTSPPAAGSSPDDRFLNGLNPDNSKVAAALKACESKLPSFGGGGF